jgi:enoyl-CoA hydratase/carnithine racemase
MMTPAPISLECRASVWWLQIDRPKVLNALDVAACHRLADLVRDAAAEPSVRALVILGAGGRAFSTGADLKQFGPDESDDSLAKADLASRRLYDELRNCPKPVVAAVDGYCLAAGFEIALLCDIIVATVQSSFGLPEVRRSLLPEAGLLALPGRLPQGELNRLLLTGAPISAPRAFQLGLVQELCEDRDALIAAVDQMTGELSLGAPLTIAAYKQMLRAHAGPARDRAGPIRDQWWERISNSEDRLEGARAFLEKRAPVWRDG